MYASLTFTIRTCISFSAILCSLSRELNLSPLPHGCASEWFALRSTLPNTSRVFETDESALDGARDRGRCKVEVREKQDEGHERFSK